MKKGGLKTILKAVCVLMILTIGISVTVGAAMAIYVNIKMEKTIDETLFQMVGIGTDTTVYYYEKNQTTGELEARAVENESLYGGYRRVYTDINSIPEDLKDAFISIEDKRFYKHKGVDWKRTISAGLNYFLKFSDSFGGSTITQQLIKNVTDKDEYSFQRKIQEIFWALDLETKMNKDEILGLYLNVINLSQGCYGVAAAADMYFSKDVSELSLNECACIAAITNSPSYYDPIKNPDNNKKRKDIILDQMYQQGYIKYEELISCKGVDVVLNVNSEHGENYINSWYIDMVVSDIINDLVSKGYSRSVANLMVYAGGLKIYTAMDPEIQAILDEYYSKVSNFYSSTEGEVPQSSMIIIDPHNGDILGVAGAVGEKNANRIQNFATQTLRPPGSVIKPISVYAPALEGGVITWSSVYDDVPVSFGNYNLDPSKGTVIRPVAWPKNSDGIYRGLTNINYAVENSINTVTVKVLESLGVEKSFDFVYNDLNMHNMIKSGYDADGGYVTDMDVAALALGQLNYGVTVREITAAYSVFANDGVYNSCRSYYKVTDGNGSIILENKYNGKAVLSEENATIMGKMLENVVQNGTAKKITLKNSVACAGKTGTTQNNYDRWYIGYTPSYIGGVWYGYEYPKPLSGSNICIEVWDEVMTEIYKRKELLLDTDFDYSQNIIECEYCADSGKLMTDACRKDPRGNRSEKGYFKKGTEPSDYCDRHIPVLYDQTEGGVSLFDMCSFGELDYVGLILVERSFPIQIYVTDAQYVWKDIGNTIIPETSPELPFFNNIIGKDSYCGISKAESQYNRLCIAHFNYYEWLKQKNGE